MSDLGQSTIVDKIRKTAGIFKDEEEVPLNQMIVKEIISHCSRQRLSLES